MPDPDAPVATVDSSNSSWDSTSSRPSKLSVDVTGNGDVNSGSISPKSISEAICKMRVEPGLMCSRGFCARAPEMPAGAESERRGSLKKSSSVKPGGRSNSDSIDARESSLPSSEWTSSACFWSYAWILVDREFRGAAATQPRCALRRTVNWPRALRRAFRKSSLPDQSWTERARPFGVSNVAHSVRIRAVTARESGLCVWLSMKDRCLRLSRSLSRRGWSTFAPPRKFRMRPPAPSLIPAGASDSPRPTSNPRGFVRNDPSEPVTEAPSSEPIGGRELRSRLMCAGTNLVDPVITVDPAVISDRPAKELPGPRLAPAAKDFSSPSRRDHGAACMVAQARRRGCLPTAPWTAPPR